MQHILEKGGCFETDRASRHAQILAVYRPTTRHWLIETQAGCCPCVRARAGPANAARHVYRA